MLARTTYFVQSYTMMGGGNTHTGSGQLQAKSRDENGVEVDGLDDVLAVRACIEDEKRAAGVSGWGTRPVQRTGGLVPRF